MSRGDANLDEELFMGGEPKPRTLPYWRSDQRAPGTTPVLVPPGMNVFHPETHSASRRSPCRGGVRRDGTTEFTTPRRREAPALR